jgi:hypothetical protein
MAAKLNQIIALVNGKKTKSQKAMTEVYHNLQKPTLFEGVTKTYEPLEENSSDVQPSEVKLVQYKVSDAISSAREALTELLDVTATQDWANCKAKADVVVDGQVVLSGVPVTYLLFLEKQLTDLHTLVNKLPVLDTAEKWTYSDESDSYQTERTFRYNTKKVPRNHVKAEATDKHPAQVEMYYEDQPVGRTYTTKFSSAIPVKRRNELIARVEKLQEAVKLARESANMVEVESVKVAGPVFNFIFG